MMISPKIAHALFRINNFRDRVDRILNAKGVIIQKQNICELSDNGANYVVLTYHQIQTPPTKKRA